MRAQILSLPQQAQLRHPQPAHRSQPVAGEQDFDSSTLLQGRREILIRHGESVYRLRHTSNDKLILTK
ncbi:MAG: hemin uptake protein HemP [Pseudoxanthomonas sp.]